MVVYYGAGMHDFIVREIEVGTRVALAEDMESLGFGVWVGLSLIEHLEAERLATAAGCCDSCRGTGYSIDGPCWDCQGSCHPHLLDDTPCIPYPPSEATR